MTSLCSYPMEIHFTLPRLTKTLNQTFEVAMTNDKVNRTVDLSVVLVNRVLATHQHHNRAYISGGSSSSNKCI